ncbi:hypothetical protein QTI33_34740 [Variovorax sp. J22P271]|uniref:hypothetical protein n=1 Tax=Variovorax davisae TaxID=3053515 RepID=UPI002577E9DA|nr:hypothetical protein [Variovorax sp. J22P271]MDM0037327.1 hypothetical protein [Variovorax sp. J22P271]
MADDRKKKGQDRKRSALTEPHEMRSWTESQGRGVNRHEKAGRLSRQCREKRCGART